MNYKAGIYCLNGRRSPTKAGRGQVDRKPDLDPFRGMLVPSNEVWEETPVNNISKCLGLAIESQQVTERS